MLNVRRLLERKSLNFIAVTPAATVGEVLQVLATKRIGLVLVVEGEALEGVFSERDAIRLAVAHGQIPVHLPVTEVMTREVFTVTQDLSVDDCMSLMIEKGIRHVPVMEGPKVIGLVSMRDVVLEAVAQRETTIRGLENYIIGGDYPPEGGR